MTLPSDVPEAPKPASEPREFREGDRVAVKRSGPRVYGHIAHICDCERLRGFRCVRVALHPSCTEDGSEEMMFVREMDLEHID
ncbi:hypothetical protein SEA_LEOPARD_98 [Mycobacterium phage Leopard]|uniref:Uncharacterized protein n=1 Tax=Mycobacterium phage Onyinye TaxID=2686235 RepID=A0A6B9L721_9CAUD|nr:hypothetical protein PP339_gp099 [Mycobacterium phage Onyinye]QHB37502.1 hypothetical protein SEA_ONYINYE_99 [Mycobacterium phage Onyinye]UOW92974.1 hypothetical protein SEA_LEOPARD_98 [Mycobacterium phage Leopard]WKW85262.1 hypothetical protein SEA_AIKOY__100 [Mycobacterium phage Aikoy]